MKAAKISTKLVLAAATMLLPGLANAQDVLRGQALAERWCASCHVVTRTATAAPSDAVPTFPAVAARKETTAATLKGAMTGTHSKMPDFQLGARDQDDLVAYIFSLKPQ